MLITSWILLVIATTSSTELTGNHICEVEESYPVNVTQYSLRNVTLRNYKWCMGIPPRCSFYTYRTVNVPEIVEKFETRRAKKCCKGFIENEEHTECVPCKKCFEGTCGIGGKCFCNSGFHGIDCTEACQPMRWGIDCKYDCLCERGSCNPRTGRCECPSGWFGTRCELLCLEGFYGKHCINRCKCGERDLCNPETGECIMKRNHLQEHQSTRAIHFTDKDRFEDINNYKRMKSTPSLKIYHTFDQDLSTPEPPFKGKKNRFQVESTKMMGTNPVSNPSVPKFTVNKKLSTGIKMMYPKREDSFESTTEVIEEIFVNREIVPIINEEGSFERNVLIEEDRKKITEKNRSMKNEIVMHFTPEMNSKHKNFPSTSFEITSNRSSNRRMNITYIKTNLGNPETNGNFMTDKTLTNKFDTTIDLRGDPFKEYEKHLSNFEHNGTEPTNIFFKTVNRSSASEIFTVIITDDDSQEKLKRRKNYIQTTTNRNAFTRSGNSARTTVAMNKQKRVKDKKNTIMIPMNTTNEMNIINSTPAHVRSFTSTLTKPILKDPQSEKKHTLSVLEDDKLQLLDTMNILTSTEVSTISHDLTTVLAKGAVIPSTQEIIVTRSYLENMGNDLPSIHPSESKKPLKEAFDFPRREDDNFSRDEPSGEYDYSTDRNTLSAHMAVGGFISFFLVLIISVLILIHHYIRRKRRDVNTKSEQHQNYSGRPSVSVYTHSIFHTPLPEPPPTFENPIFITPTENSVDPRTFQTHVVCSLNFPSHRIEEKEYTYDHPPSTGSYRAASIPEPPELHAPISVEPLYDEIPSNMKENFTSPPPSYKSSCIYVNTCGKTKL